MSNEPNQTRRGILLGLTSFLLAPLGGYGGNILDLSSQYQQTNNFRRDPFVDPYNKELNFQINAKGYFEKMYGKKAGEQVSIAFRSLNESSRNDYQFNPLLLMAQIARESNFGDTRTFVSSVGAVGSTQVMPYTAEEEPFNLKVFNPDYYKEARNAHENLSRKLVRLETDALLSIQNLARDKEFKKLYDELAGFRDEWGFVDKESMSRKTKNNYEDTLRDLKDIFHEKMGRKLSDMTFDYLDISLQYDSFRDKLDDVYNLYEDDVGEQIFLDYEKGQINNLRNNRLWRLQPRPKLKPEAELLGVEERAIDRLVIPGSWREMQRLMRVFKGNPVVAVAAYNAGQSRIRGGMLPPRIGQTWDYLGWVFYYYQKFCKDLRIEATL